MRKEPKILWPVEEATEFFNNIKLPTGEFKLNECAIITNVPLFVSTHLNIITKQNGKKAYKPYFDRLVQFKELLTKTLSK